MKKTIYLLLAFCFANAAAMAQETAAQEITAKTDEISVRKSPRGMIIVGKGADVRVFQPFRGRREVGEQYAAVVNSYAELLEGRVQMYCMVLPEAAAFYTPATAEEWTNPVQPAIENVYAALNPRVKPIDAYSALQPHTAEAIYLRTDHHWAPLGAYYAAEAFAKAAQVPFLDLSHFDTDTIHGFIGTMNKFSGNNACRFAPEDFIWYVPQNTNTQATVVKYKLAGGKAVGEESPVEENFFYRYKQGSGLAYCTFMGGDSRTVKIPGMVKNGRKLLITKDSFGNPLPAYLLNSFDEIHVIDPRYFSKSLPDYIETNEITDWLVTNCVTFVHNNVTANNLAKLKK